MNTKVIKFKDDINHLGFIDKMRKEKLPEDVILSFLSDLITFKKDSSRKISLNNVKPVESIHIRDTNCYTKLGIQFAEELAVLKLNGGIATTMALTTAKSSLVVKDDLTFMDIICKNLINFNETNNLNVPLILMNSFHTKNDTDKIIAKFKNALYIDDFLQSKYPKINIETMNPIYINPEVDWNPPGHGELYARLNSSGLINELKQRGINYLFISNSDNLGAIIDPKILGYMVANDIDFLMETVPKTIADVKGGIIVKDEENKLKLIERNQVSEEDIKSFEDIKKFKEFNTNNLWIKIDTVTKLIEEKTLNLSLIVNKKNINGINIVQLESACGSAISCFENAKTIEVGRDRFFPVKSQGDFIAVQSDYLKYVDDKLIESENRPEHLKGIPPKIILDNKFYKTVKECADHFNYNHLPSMEELNCLEIRGKITFGKNVKLSGLVEIFASDDADQLLTTIENRILKDCTVIIEKDSMQINPLKKEK